MMEDDGHKVDSAKDVRQKPSYTDRELIETDETWVMVGLSRRTCSHPVEIFGSNIRNSNTMVLTIRKATRQHANGSDSYHSRGCLIEVEMTPVQFAELITSANIGDGIPCSLREFNGKHYEYKTGRNMGDTVQTDMDDNFKEVHDRLKLAENQVRTILKRPGRVSHVEKEEMADNLMHLVQDIRKNIPFMEKQFRETMDKSVLEAKQNIQAFMESTIHRLGVSKLELDGSKAPQLMIGDVADADSEPPNFDGGC